MNTNDDAGEKLMPEFEIVDRATIRIAGQLYGTNVPVIDTIRALRQTVARQAGEIERLTEDAINKVMAMTEDQVNALTRLQGRNPDDVAKIGRQILEIVTLTHRAEQAESRAAVLRDAVVAADALTKKFIDKVESGGAYSKTTYAECVKFQSDNKAAISAAGSAK